MKVGNSVESKKALIYDKIRAAVQLIESRTKIKPKLGMILGSGLGPLADEAQDRTVISYSEIPYFHGTSVEGHAGQMILGFFQGIPTVFLQGRFHYYEGYPMEEVVLPTRVVCGLGIETLVLTNAAGGVNKKFQARDLMIITDHLNLMSDNPLKGPNLKELGPRFPDLTEAYAKRHIETIKKAAKGIKLSVRTGVYAGLQGPTYETPAEVRMLRGLGADAVGMSTVPESIAANHLGVQVVGISLITNLAAGMTKQKLTHDEVLENSKLGCENMKRLLKASAKDLVSL